MTRAREQSYGGEHQIGPAFRVAMVADLAAAYGHSPRSTRPGSRGPSELSLNPVEGHLFRFPEWRPYFSFLDLPILAVHSVLQNESASAHSLTLPM